MGIKSEIRITNRIVPRERDGKCASRTVTVTSGGGSSDIEELSDWFLSSVSDDEAKGVINFLKGIKISGHDLKRILGTEAEDEDITDDDILTGLFIIDHFIRKDKPDTAGEFITFLKGWYGGNFQQGSTGAGLWQDEQGAWHLELDYAHFRRKLTAEEIEVQKTTHIGGKLMETAAGMSCIKVEDLGDYWRCYMRTKDSEGRIIYNQFKVKDQALVETFNLQKQSDGTLGNHFLWRLVVAVGTDYIDLSKDICAAESDAPLAGDDIVQLGYQGTDDPNRQNAQILAGAGEGSPYIKQYVGINSFVLPEEYTRIKPGDNLLTGRMNLQPGSTGSANLTDLPDEIYNAVQIGNENLLLNSGFTGDYDSIDISESTQMQADTEVYSPKIKYWEGDANIVEDSEAVSGYRADIGYLSQEVNLMLEEQYVISLRAKGTSLTVGYGDYNSTESLDDTYKKYVYKFTCRSLGVFFISGKASVCDIKLERGTIPTDWCPSRLDTDKSADRFKYLQYIQDAIKDGSVDILGGLILANMIQLGNYKNGKLQKVTAGISGIYNDDDDVAFWAGGTLQQAMRTIARLKSNPDYSPSDSEWGNLAKFIATHGGDIFLKGYIYAVGGLFRGRVETAIDGKRIVIDPVSKTLKMFTAEGNETVTMRFDRSEEGYEYGDIILKKYSSNNEELLKTTVYPERIRIENKVEKTDILIAPENVTVIGGNGEVMRVGMKAVYSDISSRHYISDIFSSNWPTSEDSVETGGVYMTSIPIGDSIISGVLRVKK